MATTHAKVWTDNVEDQAAQQIGLLTQLPFIHHHIAVMADVHAGMGSTIGSVIPTKGAIIPAAVGVDIGCGMMAYQTDIRGRDLPDRLSTLRFMIEENVPHGRSANGGPNDRGAWSEYPHGTEGMWFQHAWESLWNDERLQRVMEKHPKLIGPKTNHWNHLGSLGTGNHFIEVCLDEFDHVWIMLHSGSRGVGNRIGQYFIELAKKDMETWFINVPDKNLAYLPDGTEYFDDYIDAMTWAQEYAYRNRELMMRQTMRALRAFVGYDVGVTDMAINCHHNYAALENHYGANVWVTRKGAVRARAGDLGIIPGSMGAKSYIVRGLGNEASFSSCSHGAGRRMSRTAARSQFTAADLAAATDGVECRKDDGVVDEIPGAYKDIDEVMANQTDLVEVVATLKQIVNVKG